MKYFFLSLIFIISLTNCANQLKENTTHNTSSKIVTKDPLAPTSDAADALTGGLHTATLATTSLEDIKKFYVDGMGMSLEGPLPVDATTKQQQRQLWDIPKDINWETYRLYRPSVPSLIQIRLMVLNKETPLIHKSWSARELGPFSLGFPNLNQEQLDKELRTKGFESMAALQEGTVPRSDGTSYRYIETIYKAPDYLHAVGIERKDGMNQLAPVDSLTQKGGPGYSAMVLKDSDTFLKFLTDVLGQELRADREWKSSPGSALGIEEGVPFRFALVYAKGHAYNHLLFLDYKDGQYIELDVTPKVPNRGLGMWTFKTKDIQEIKSNAEKMDIQILQEPMVYNDPILGKVKVMTMLAPNGFLIEIFEPT